VVGQGSRVTEPATFNWDTSPTKRPTRRWHAKGPVESPLIIPDFFGGETEFGRQCQNYRDIGSRLNFALALAASWDRSNYKKRISKKDIVSFDDFWKSNDPDHFYNLVEMIRKAFLEEVGVELFIKMDEGYVDDDHKDVCFSIDILLNDRDFDELDDPVSINLDHGSNWGEMPCNLSIFESLDTLKDFIFNDDSYVANQGDEYDPLERIREPGQWATIERAGYSKEYFSEPNLLDDTFDP
jgi:hypothetical protein